MHLTSLERQIYLVAIDRAMDHLLNGGRVKRAEFAHRAIEIALEVVAEHRLQQKIARARKARRGVRR